MAMVHDPALLVLDEPTTGVDPVSRVELWRLAAHAAAAGTTVVMSSTYMDEAERASQVLVLDQGHALVAGPPAEVVAGMQGVLTEGARPQRMQWAWRRGRFYREYWPDGLGGPEGAPGLPAGQCVIDPDLEDVVITGPVRGPRRRAGETGVVLMGPLSPRGHLDGIHAAGSPAGTRRVPYPVHRGHS